MLSTTYDKLDQDQKDYLTYHNKKMTNLIDILDDLYFYGIDTEYYASVDTDYESDYTTMFEGKLPPITFIARYIIRTYSDELEELGREYRMRSDNREFLEYYGDSTTSYGYTDEEVNQVYEFHKHHIYIHSI